MRGRGVRAGRWQTRRNAWTITARVCCCCCCRVRMSDRMKSLPLSTERKQRKRKRKREQQQQQHRPRCTLPAPREHIASSSHTSSTAHLGAVLFLAGFSPVFSILSRYPVLQRCTCFASPFESLRLPGTAPPGRSPPVVGFIFVIYFYLPVSIASGGT